MGVKREKDLTEGEEIVYGKVQYVGRESEHGVAAGDDSRCRGVVAQR